MLSSSVSQSLSSRNIFVLIHRVKSLDITQHNDSAFLNTKEAADRLATRVSSLEVQVLDGRAELASAQAHSEGTASELAAAREAAREALGCLGDMKDMKAVAAAEARAREESLNAEIANLKNALKVLKYFTVLL